jgi:hypothetical protein
MSWHIFLFLFGFVFMVVMFFVPLFFFSQPHLGAMASTNLEPVDPCPGGEIVPYRFCSSGGACKLPGRPVRCIR